MRNGHGHAHTQFEALAELQQQGLIRQMARRTVNLDQLAEAQQIAPVACAQNVYNIANWADEAVLPPPPSSASRTCRTSRSAASSRCSRTCRSPSPSGSAPRERREAITGFRRLSSLADPK
jgi:hypothetical protein